MSPKQQEKSSAIAKAIRPHLMKWAISTQSGDLKAASQALKDAKAAADRATTNSPREFPNIYS